MKPKVLVGVVTYDGKDYIFPKNYEIVSNLTYDNYDFVIVDNSKSLNYARKLRRRGCKNVVHLDRSENSRMTLAMCQNYLRQKVLNSNYDYLLLIESDLLPPRNVIERFLEYEVPVVGATYFIGTGKLKLPCIFFDTMIRKGIKGTRLIGTWYDNNGKKYFNPDEVKGFLNTGLRKCHGVGFGTTLIRRDVLSSESFWYDERFADKHSDVYFYMNLSLKKIPVFVDTNLIVPHFPSKWTDVSDR